MGKRLDQLQPGDILEAAHVRELHRLARRRIRVVEDSGLTIRSTVNEDVIGIEQRRFQKKSEVIAGSAIQLILRSVQVSFMICDTFIDGVSGDSVLVAMPYFLRGADVWDGETRGSITYSYPIPSLSQRRNASKDGQTELQTIVPGYGVGDILMAASAEIGYTTQGGEEVTMVDLNVDGRMWATSAD